MLLVLLKVERLLDLAAEALALGGLAVAVAAVLLLVDVAGTSALRIISYVRFLQANSQAYAGVEFVLTLASADLGNKVLRATSGTLSLWSETRTLRDVASSTTTRGEVAIGGFSLHAFADNASISINVAVRTNVTSAWDLLANTLARETVSSWASTHPRGQLNGLVG
jgi:hypothetical protein